jgi:CheY-like chemotaxis protein
MLNRDFAPAPAPRGQVDVPAVAADPRTAATTERRPVVLLAVSKDDVGRYPAVAFMTVAAHSTADALRCIERMRPRVVSVDWELPSVDGSEICRAALRFSTMSVLATMAAPEHAPSALRAGCHGVLLKPFPPNLAAARFGRLSREGSGLPPPALHALGHHGTNRTWHDMRCPTCSTAGATGFEYSSHRRMWYACLACDHVWLGRRRE